MTFKFTFKKRNFSTLVLLIMLYISMLAIAIIKPPFQSPDEFDHYKKSISVANGQWLQQSSKNGVSGVFLKEYYLDFMDKFKHLPFTPNAKMEKVWVKGYSLEETTDLKFTESPGTGPYAPILYLMQGYLHGALEMLNSDLFINYKIIVGLNLLLFFIVSTNVYLSSNISIMPLLFVMSAPLFMFQIGSWSIDSIYFSLTILLCNFLIQRKYIGFVSLLIPIIASSRIAFAVFYLPLLFIEKKKIYYFSLILIGVGSLLFWVIFAVRDNPNLGSTGVEVNFINFTKDPMTTLKFLINEIINFGRIIGQFKMAIGQLGWLDYSVSESLKNWYLVIWIAFCLICAFNLFDKKCNHKSLILSGMLMWPVVNIIVGIYTTDFSVTKFGIMGIQGRYFYPSLITFALYLGYRYQSDIERYYRFIWTILFFTISLSSVSTITATFTRYY